MPRKATTRADRAAQVATLAKGIEAMVANAVAAESNGAVTAPDQWAAVAERAGAIQRRTRQLAGLGRGG